jgi:tetratricopeptide (TPR) repeat protein
MSGIHPRRLLPAYPVLAALILMSQLLHAQVASAADTSFSHPQEPVVAQTSLPITPAPSADTKHPLSAEETGDLLMAYKRYQAAIAAYKTAPHDSADVWNKMGIAYQMMYNYNEAGRCYEASLKINPNSAHVLNNMGTISVSLKDYKSAEKYYRRALKFDPNSAVILKNLGTDLLARHKYKEGGKIYAAALAIDPQIFDTLSNPRMEDPTSVQSRGAMNFYMAKTCVRAGMNDRAIEYLRMALNDGFTNPKKIVADSEFAGLRGLPAFEQLLAEQRNP